MFTFAISAIFALLNLITGFLVGAGARQFGPGSILAVLWSGFAPVTAFVVLHLLFKHLLRVPSPFNRPTPSPSPSPTPARSAGSAPPPEPASTGCSPGPATAASTAPDNSPAAHCGTYWAATPADDPGAAPDPCGCNHRYGTNFYTGISGSPCRSRRSSAPRAGSFVRTGQHLPPRRIDRDTREWVQDTGNNARTAWDRFFEQNRTDRR